MHQHNISKSSYVGGVAVSIAASLLLVLAGVAKGGRTGMELVALAWLPLLVTATLMGSLIYRMWAAIQDSQTPVGPGKAVALLFVPFFNFSWAFYVLPGFADAYNAYLERHGIEAQPISARLLRAYVILCIGAWVPMLGVVCSLLAVPVGLAMIAMICDAINALGAHSAQRRAAPGAEQANAGLGGTDRPSSARTVVVSEKKQGELISFAAFARSSGTHVATDPATAIPISYAMQAERDNDRVRNEQPSKAETP